MSPESSSLFILIIDIPVDVSPFKIADWIGDAPLYFGRIEKWILIGETVGKFNNQLGIIFP